MFYTVQYGDTLHSIANDFGTTMLSLAQLNNLPYPYSINEGDTLLIAFDTVRPPAYNYVTNASEVGNEYVNA